MAGSLEGVLANIPGLAGYLAAQQQDQRGQLSQVQQLSGLQGILSQVQQGQARQQAMQEEQQLRGVLSQSGGDPAKAVQALLQAGTPKALSLAAQLKGMMPPPPQDRVMTPGSTLLGADGNVKFFAPDRAPKEQNQSNLARLMAERDALPQGDPRRGNYDNAIRKESETARQISPTINIPRNPQWIEIEDPLKPGFMIKVNPDLYREESYRSGNKSGVLGRAGKMTQAGAIDAKADLAMGGLSADLQAAEDLLTGVKRTSDGQAVRGNLPTGSGVGSLYDKAAGFIGMSPAGAEEATELKTVAARLVGRVPRFEGPQSDKDVALYKEAAADAGNENKPRIQRLAAIKRMRAIYAGYESGERGRITGGRRGGDGAPETVKVDW